MAIKSKEDLTEVERLEKALRAFRSKTPKIGLMQRGDTYPVFDITNPAKHSPHLCSWCMLAFNKWRASAPASDTACQGKENS